MSDDLNKKIMQIADLLGKESMPDNVKGLLGLLASSMGSGESAPKSSETPAVKTERSEKNEFDDNLEMIRKVKKVMEKVNTRNDPRINLLNAIKPFLNNKRQKRLGNCIKILYMSNLAGYIDEHDKS